MAAHITGTQNDPHIVILGGGVIGLSTAAALLCSKDDLVSQLRITVVAKEFSPNTTSDIAGGLWLPYKATHPDLSRWCSETLEWLLYLREKGCLPLNSSLRPNSAENKENPYRVNLVDCISYEATNAIAEDRATWESALKVPARRMPLATLPFVPQNANDCWVLPSLPLITTGKYLVAMRKELASTGRVQFIQDKDLTRLEQVASKYGADVVVNCTGLGSRDLAHDSTVVPVRGCLLSLELPLEEKQKLMGRVFIYDDNPEGLTYILPREDGCHVGGTYLPNQWDSTVSEEEEKLILARGIATVPELATGKIIKRRAGLRPSRPHIRIQRDLSVKETKTGTYLQKPMFFHNYGHGGSGWTVHWGCALSTAKLVLTSLSNEKPVTSTANIKAKL